MTTAARRDRPTLTLDRILRRGDDGPPQHRPVDYDVLTPLSYWTGRPTFPPEPAKGRVERINLHRRLFRGDLAPILTTGSQRVEINYFERTSLFLADLMASPASLEVRGGPDDLDLVPLVLRTVHRMALDQSRYGTGILLAGASGETPELHYRYPGALFPATQPGPDGRWASWALAYEQPSPNGAEAGPLEVITYGGGTYRRRTIGAQPVEGVAAPGEESVVMDNPLYVVQRWPDAGGWGLPIYQSMIPLVAELCRRASSNSISLDRHERPIVVEETDDRALAFAPEQSDLGAQLRQETAQAAREDWRAQDVAQLPQGVKGVSYLQWDAQMQGAGAHIQRVMDALYTTTSIPAALYSASGSGTVSGVALRRLYAPTYVYIDLVIASLRPTLEAALGAAMQSAGRDERPTIEWANPLDHLDQITVVQQPAAATPPTGEGAAA